MFRCRLRCRLISTNKQHRSRDSVLVIAGCVGTTKIESSDEDGGRERKISAKWRMKQQQRPVSYLQYEDGFWPDPAGTEIYLGFNSVDFSTSSEAFNDEPDEPVDINEVSTETDSLQFESFDAELLFENEVLPYPDYFNIKIDDEPKMSVDNKDLAQDTSKNKNKLSLADVAKQVTAMEFTGDNMWRLPGLYPPEKVIRHLTSPLRTTLRTTLSVLRENCRPSV